ncbi:hypothetical protein [Crateriforma conspicua]|uniref:Uncharacterized protein n=1 Tax=Crateriforma conspicua TaxID=2527996 RepID=A0A5C6FYN8_9PLAN|nr:hypothetical protein [Crateriforma conspicua]TWU67486.1 hypothetical protein V7x_30600 [Crateriforma conspicua]
MDPTASTTDDRVVGPSDDRPHHRGEPERSDGAIEASFQPIQRSRLVPQISIRWLFAATLVGAILYAIARQAGEGVAIAIAFMSVAGYLAAFFATLGLFFLIAWSFAVFFRREDPDALVGSPFADGQLPPQWLPPRDRSS